MKKVYVFLLIVILLLINGCSNKFESLKYFLGETKLKEYKVIYQENYPGLPILKEGITEFSYKNGKFRWSSKSIAEGVESKLSLYKIDNKIYSCNEVKANQFELKTCNIFLNETQTKEYSNPGFIINRLEEEFKDYDIKFSGIKKFVDINTYCFNAKSDNSEMEICFTKSAIPLYIKEITRLPDVDISYELKAVKFEEEVDDLEFILPAEPGKLLSYDPNAIKKIEGDYKGPIAKNCSLFTMEKTFGGYLYFDFSECAELSTSDENADIELSYQNGRYDIGRKGNTRIMWINKNFEETNLNDCNEIDQSSTLSSITPQNNEGVVCISTKDNKFVKVGKISETENMLTLSWKILN